jgi:predicted GNAT family acetyltransferase
MSDSSEEPRVRDNPDEERYELWLGETLAGTIDYSMEPDRIVLIHTEVDPSFEGKGLASKLVSSALQDIRARGLKMVPACQFVRSYLRRHPEYDDLRAPLE